MTGSSQRDRERERLTTDLLVMQGKPVRLLFGPVGAGKSTALLHYARRLGDARAAYIRMPAGATPSDFHARLSAIPTGASEIIFDHVDTLPMSTVETMISYVIEHCEAQRFIITGRSEQRIRAYDVLARGIAMKIDPAILAFDAEEAAALASSYNVPHEPEDIVQLLHDTDGWAIAVDWALRCASYDGFRLREAYESWLELQGHHLLRFVASRYGADGRAFAEFLRCVEAGKDTDAERFEDFAACGFPLVRTRSGRRPYRLVLRLLCPDNCPSAVAPDAPAMQLKLLGRLRCTIGERALTFKRRRDRHVFLYVALRTDGRATRDELLATFWPNVERAVAASALRTTLSHIRQAIAEVAGVEAVDRFFRADHDVRVDFAAVSSDVRQFWDHLESARARDALADYAGARTHYEAADCLYEDSLLSSEPAETCFQTILDTLEQAHAAVLGRIMSICTDAGDHEATRRSARRLLAKSPVEERRGSGQPVLQYQLSAS